MSLLLREEDMPVTKNGIRPTILFNSHGLPTRMTIATYIEMLTGNICAKKGANVDGTIFRKTDIESMALELESLGMHRYGYERMIHGITGEYIDSLIFFGPVYYQRLQKFIADAEYSVRHAATDALTLQAADSGRSANGGLKIGEMEKDVICAHGTMAVLQEKFYNHSDGFTEFICACGKPAVVNHAMKLYECKHCGDLADIKAIPTSWSSKLFMQELMSAGIGIKRAPRPFTYETYAPSAGDRANDDVYNRRVIKQLDLALEAAANVDEDQTVQKLREQEDAAN